VAGRVHEVEAEASVVEGHGEALTEMPRSFSICMKSDAVRRASPLARTWPGHLDGAPEEEELLGQRGLAGVGCEMIAKVRRRAISGGSGRLFCMDPTYGRGGVGATGGARPGEVGRGPRGRLTIRPGWL
jgi:hypothetical protein